MNDAKKPPRIGIRPFAEIICDLAQGDIERRLTEELAQVVRACESTSQKGKLVITLSVEPGPKMMCLKIATKQTIPQPAMEATQFFSDDKGGLHVQNPRQTQMFDGPKSILPTNDGEN